MRSDTQKRIEQYKAMLPAAKERIVAVALLLAMSVVMMASTSYAWLTLSRAPEVKGMNTTISGNGNLEIALADGIYGATARATEENVKGEAYFAGGAYNGGAITNVIYDGVYTATITYTVAGESHTDTVENVKNKTEYQVGNSYNGGTITAVTYADVYAVDVTYVPGGTELKKETLITQNRPHEVGQGYADGIISDVTYERYYQETIIYEKDGVQQEPVVTNVGGKRYTNGDEYDGGMIVDVYYEGINSVSFTYKKDNVEHTVVEQQVAGEPYGVDGDYNGGTITSVAYTPHYEASITYVPSGRELKTQEKSAENEKTYQVGGMLDGSVITHVENYRIYTATIDYIVGPGASMVGDSSASIGQTLTGANITWGNLINLSDNSYGLDRISLRPARLKTNYNLQQTPLGIAKYTSDGRLENTTSEICYFAKWDNTNQFFTAKAGEVGYGVRAITSATTSNITANATATEMMTRAEIAYSQARAQYLAIIKGQTYVNTEGHEQVTGMEALTGVIELYVQITADQFITRFANSSLPGASGTTSGREDNFSGLVTYAYRLILQVQDVLDKEGEALLYLANCQAYLAGSDKTETFASVSDLLGQYKAWTANNKVSNDFAKYKIQLDSLETYQRDYTNIRTAASRLKNYAEQCDPETVPEANRPKITWNQISGAVNLLVNINETQIGKNEGGTHYEIRELASISSSDMNKMLDFLGIINSCQSASTPADIILGNGVWTNIENRLPAEMTQMLKNSANVVQVNIQGKATAVIITVNLGKAPLNAKLRTEAKAPFDSVNDFSATGARDNNALPTDLVAKDTYGLAIDLWLRTNVYGTVLKLEGNLEWADEPVYGVDKDGNSVLIYIVEKGTTEEDSGYIEEAYQLGDKWYSAASHAELGAVADMTEGYTITQKTQEVVVGYDGVNRIWEEYKTLIESGMMQENNTTQGAGSCYVFYADPADTGNILNMLKAFRVAFIDASGTSLATGFLNTEHAFTSGGKTTVPLELMDGYAYKNGEEECYGITALAKDEATWITAIVYLDGENLSNEDVLAVGEIEGTLNIQFGSNIDLSNMDDTELRNNYRDIEARVSSGEQTSSNANQPIRFAYDGNAKQVTVTLNVDGDQPNNISAFFVRAVGANGGTQGTSVPFTRDGNIWTATFDLTSPGTYSLRNLIVDGSYYALDEFPTVKIEGREIKDVVVLYLNKGVTMTAANSITAQIQATVDDSVSRPQSVRAVFVSASGGMVQSQMSYNASTGKWWGNVTFNESGTYTLKYLYVDGLGEELAPSQQSSYILYLGLRADIFLAEDPKPSEAGTTEEGTTEEGATKKEPEPIRFGSVPISFEYKGPRNINVAVRLYDDSGREMTDLPDVTVVYQKSGSLIGAYGLSAKLTWDKKAINRNGVYTAAYVGKFQVNAGGKYEFDHITIKQGDNENTVTVAVSRPTITALVLEPPEFKSLTVQDYQFAPKGDADALVTVENGQTAYVWAKFRNEESKTEHLVYYSRITTDDTTATFTFPIPTENGTQDGKWKLTALYMQNCADANNNWVEASMDDPTTSTPPEADKCYVYDLTDEQTKVTTVVQTVKVNAVYAENTKLGEGSRPFMQAISPNALTVTVTDKWGNEIAAEYITSAKWTFSFDRNTQAYGGYTTTNTGIGEIGEIAGTVTDGNISFAAPTFYESGKYTSTVTVVVGGKTFEVVKPSFEVYSIAPTVKITGISPTGNNPTKITWTESVGFFVSTHEFTATDSKTGAYTEYSATLYAKATVDNSIRKSGNFEKPKLTITVSQIGNADSATVVLPAGEKTDAVTYEFAADGAVTKELGKTESIKDWNGGMAKLYAYYGHGTQTIRTLTLKYNGVTYTVTLPNPITITNPSSVNQT